MRYANTYRITKNSPAAKGGDPKLSDIVFVSADYLSLGYK